MIPETGKRAELKQAWFDSIKVPVVGELYLYHAPMKMYYRVIEVDARPRGHVRVESYSTFDEWGCYKRVGSTYQFTLRQWRMNLKHRQITYHSSVLPPVRGVVI